MSTTDAADAGHGNGFGFRLRALHKAPALHVPAWQGARCAFWYAFLGPVPSLDYAWIWPEA